MANVRRTIINKRVKQMMLLLPLKKTEKRGEDLKMIMMTMLMTIIDQSSSYFQACK
jgi:hypothetical protein